MGRIKRSVEEKKRILQELEVWRAKGGTVKQFALERGIERKNLYAWDAKFTEKSRTREKSQPLTRRKEFVQVRTADDCQGDHRHVVSVPIRIMCSSGVCIELSAGCRKEDLELVISSIGERA